MQRVRQAGEKGVGVTSEIERVMHSERVYHSIKNEIRVGGIVISSYGFLFPVGTYEAKTEKITERDCGEVYPSSPVPL